MKKLIIAFMIVLMTIPSFMPIFALTKNELISKLDSLAVDINDMKEEYNDVINNYPEVIDSLSDEAKAIAKDLSNNLLAEDIEANVKLIKEELAASSHEDASKVLEAIDGLQDRAEVLIDENKDLVDEIKTGYTDLSINDAKEVMDKVADITESLGASKDTTATYNEMMSILDKAHADALKINTKIEKVLKDNTNLYKEVLTIDILLDLAEDVKAKDREAVIDTLTKAVEGKEGIDTLKASLRELKNDAIAVKNELFKMENLDEQDLIMFSDDQKAAVQAKVKLVEKDYIDFAKLVLNDYAEDYLKITIDLSRTTTVDEMIKYANKAIDFVLEYKDTVKELSVNDISKLNLPKDLVKKAGLMVALGFIDTSDYNKEYVEKNFKAEIENLVNFVIDEFIDYLDWLDKNMKDEVQYEIDNSNPTQGQLNIIDINLGRFTTMDNIEKLRQRVETEFLEGRERVKEEIATYMPRIYDMYNENILTTLEKVMQLEFKTDNAKYDYDNLYYQIVFDDFVSADGIASEIGMRKDKMEFSNLTSNKVKTGSALNVKLSDTAYQLYSIVVLGDVYADGLIDSRDYMAIKNIILKNGTFGAVNKAAANAYRDGLIDSRDYMVIKNYIVKDEPISIFKGIK